MLLSKWLGRALITAMLLPLSCSDDKSTEPVADGFHGFRYIGSYSTGDRANGVIVAGSYAYVAEHDSGMGIVNVGNPANPVLTGRYRCPGALQIDLKGSNAYIADESLYSLEIVSIANPSSPSLVGRLETLEVLGVRVFSNYAVMGCGHDGLQIVDISDPSDPFLRGCCEELEPLRFEIAGDLAFVPNAEGGYRGLFIVDLSDPDDPTIVGSATTGGWPYEVAVEGEFAYMTNLSDPYARVGTGYLHIIDISDATSPQNIDSLLLGRATIADFVSGDYLYVTFANPSEGYGFSIFDISDPASPQVVETQSLNSIPWDIWVVSGYIYIAANEAGMLIYEFRS